MAMTFASRIIMTSSKVLVTLLLLEMRHLVLIETSYTHELLITVRLVARGVRLALKSSETHLLGILLLVLRHHTVLLRILAWHASWLVRMHHP
jgi:hypothetical protein